MNNFEVTKETSMGLQLCCICGKPLTDTSDSYSVIWFNHCLWCCSEACVTMCVLQNQDG